MEEEKKQASTPIPPQHGDGVRAFAGRLLELVEAFVLALVVVLLLLTFVVRHSPVVGSSMYPTLKDGDVLLVSGLGYTPETGDIVIVQSKSFGLASPLVKRVIAVGGDELDINFETWEVRVNGVLLSEPYLNRGNGSMTTQSVEHLTFPMTIPDGYLFVMGDNRQGSKDSRSADIGLIDARYVVGRVWSRVLPTDNATLF
jgi:signal peptidase I